MRSYQVALWVALTAALPAAAQRDALPLNGFERLGQRFTCVRPLAALYVCMPSWSDDEGGLTLTLWDSPERRTRLAQRVLVGVRDNEMVELRPDKPLPPGSYYWEISDRTGETRIGLYVDPLPLDSDDCAWLDGQPDRRRRFLQEVAGGPPPRNTMRELVEALVHGGADEQVEACRQLAVYGTPEAVPALARLLEDPTLSHMARYALERLPGPAADQAFRSALRRLRGEALVGVINSIGVRRDALAAERLTELLGDTDAAVSGASAVALGCIGTPEAATALVAAVTQADQVGYALGEGGLRCAERLAAGGRREVAAALYQALLAARAPRPVRVAAARGAVVVSGDSAALVELLRSDDLRDVGLYVLQHELPGEAITRAVAAAFDGLPVEARGRVVTALASRRDAAVLPIIAAAATGGELPVRLAATAALPRVAGSGPVLASLLADPHEELRQRAAEGLAQLPRAAATEVAGRLLAQNEAPLRLVGAELIDRLALDGFADALVERLTDDDQAVRLAATKGLAALGGRDQVAPLRARLAACPDEELGQLESALAAVLDRVGDADGLTPLVAGGLADLAPDRAAAVLRLLSGLGGPSALRVVLDSLDSRHHTAAVEALCAWPNGVAATHLLALARAVGEGDERLTCLNAAIRLAGGGDLPIADRLAVCREAGSLIDRDDQRLRLLGALGGMASLDAIALALPTLEPEATREAACAAILSIAEKLLAAGQPDGLAAPLERVAATTTNAEFAAKAKELLARAR